MRRIAGRPAAWHACAIRSRLVCEDDAVGCSVEQQERRSRRANVKCRAGFPGESFSVRKRPAQQLIHGAARTFRFARENAPHARTDSRSKPLQIPHPPNTQGAQPASGFHHASPRREQTRREVQGVAPREDKDRAQACGSRFRQKCHRHGPEGALLPRKPARKMPPSPLSSFHSYLPFRVLSPTQNSLKSRFVMRPFDPCDMQSGKPTRRQKFRWGREASPGGITAELPNPSSTQFVGLPTAFRRILCHAQRPPAINRANPQAGPDESDKRLPWQIRFSHTRPKKCRGSGKA